MFAHFFHLTHRHMLLLSIPSILLLIYQSCLVKLKPHIGVWCLCWFMSFQMIHWKRHLTQNDRSTFLIFFLYLFFYIRYNNIIMLFTSSSFHANLSICGGPQLWIDRFSCLVALWLMCFHGLQSRSYLFDFGSFSFSFEKDFRG